MGTENEIDPAPILADIPLLLIRPVRHIASQPSGIPAGLITLRAWEVNRVSRLPPDLAGFEAYLIRMSYDLDVEPDAAAVDDERNHAALADKMVSLSDRQNSRRQTG